MGRLIDKDELLSDALALAGVELTEPLDWIRFIDERPTAYDVNAVVNQLKVELKLSHKEKRRCKEENMSQFFEAKGYGRGITNAIEIVKGELN